MFLQKLKEENKQNFLELCVLAALSNGDFAEVEKEMIREYCREMNVPVAIPDGGKELTDVLEEINKSASMEEKKIILLELLGLVKTDGFYDNQELEFIEKVIDVLRIDEKDYDRIVGLLEIYLTVCKELYVAIQN